MRNISYLNLKAINAPCQQAIKDALTEVLDSGWYLRGKCVERFESEWAAYCGQRYCASCSSGLDALTLVLKAWKEAELLKDGDEVIVPANTFIATFLAVSEAGMRPVPVDPDPLTCLITSDGIERALTSDTRAIVPVHLYGQLCEMDEIMNLALRHNLLVLEDCAQCHGINHLFDRQRALVPETHHACAWSFYPGKNLGAMGDAGAVTTDSQWLSNMVKTLANYGSSEKYVHDCKGKNSRMDEFQAAVLTAKLPDLDRCNQHRIEIAHRYIDEIVGSDVSMPAVTTASVFHIFPIMSNRRDALQSFLAERGIQTQIHYPIPAHKQKAYPEWKGLSLPVAEAMSSRELSLPCNQAMDEDDVSAVISAVNEFFAQNR